MTARSTLTRRNRAVGLVPVKGWIPKEHLADVLLGEGIIGEWDAEDEEKLNAGLLRLIVEKAKTRL